MIAIATKDRILQAANDVAARDGVIHLTLQAVANEAGVSKGGLLYHFPTKDALVAALVTRYAHDFEEALHKGLHADGRGPGAFTRAFIRATFGDGPGASHGGLPVALLAAALLNPQLLAEFRQKSVRWHRRIEQDGLDPALAALLRYATDGLWASEVLGLAPPSKQLRKRLEQLMLRLARGDEDDG